VAAVRTVVILYAASYKSPSRLSLPALASVHRVLLKQRSNFQTAEIPAALSANSIRWDELWLSAWPRGENRVINIPPDQSISDVLSSDSAAFIIDCNNVVAKVLSKLDKQ
jgi:hypothetical protein